MSTLTKTELIARLNTREIVVTPILEESQIGDASIDVRLANQFIVFRMHTFRSYPNKNEPNQSLRRMQERQVLRYGSPFILHPGMLALGCTMEYLKMPSNLECQVEGRSSWARVGLEIATANSIEPGFTGVVTLELSNAGTIPLEMFPGARVAQLVFREAVPPLAKAYDGAKKYRSAVGPEFSRLADDPDLAVFRQDG